METPSAPTPAQMPWWLRIIVVLIAVPNVVAGIWAMVAPQNWFDNFPGWAPYVVAANPPFNAHLATDAGAGLFASGLIMLIALAWRRRDVVILAAVGFLAFNVPHFLFHLFNPSDALTASEDFQGTFGLALAVVGGAVVLMWQWRKNPA